MHLNPIAVPVALMLWGTTLALAQVPPSTPPTAPETAGAGSAQQGSPDSRGSVAKGHRPGRARSIVPANGVDTYRVVFPGGRLARIQVKGLGNSDLELSVHDEFGNPVCRADNDEDEEMECAWTPAHTGTFTVRLRNLGAANEYLIQHN